MGAAAQRAGGPRRRGLRQAKGGGQEGDAIGGEGACRSGRGRPWRGWQERGLAGAAASEGEGNGFDGRGRGACCRKRWGRGGVAGALRGYSGRHAKMG